MTYNATDRILYQAIETGKLVKRAAVRPSAERRRIYVTPQIARVLDGEDEDHKGFPRNEIEVLIGRFIAGHLIVVSLNGDGAKKPDMERLQDLDDVWALCARKPRGLQVRLFGRFIEKGVFVGLGIYERGFLGFRDNYYALAAGIPNLWANIFGTREPLRAQTSLEYLDGVVRDVEEI